MALIRHKQTLVERHVPDRAVPYFPDYEVVTEASEPTEVPDSKPTHSRGRKADGESTNRE